MGKPDLQCDLIDFCCVCVCHSQSGDLTGSSGFKHGVFGYMLIFPRDPSFWFTALCLHTVKEANIPYYMKEKKGPE